MITTFEAFKYVPKDLKVILEQPVFNDHDIKILNKVGFEIIDKNTMECRGIGYHITCKKNPYAKNSI